ncbi:protein BIC1-like [Forsythia ovata]|uniref:Protein BIC1-like n=1 Tax=Forsythia ovata TaxID=205694 RepID=A0ABD1STF6_9LAMI
MKMSTPHSSNESEIENIVPPFPTKSKRLHSPEKICFTLQKPFSLEETKSKSEEENQSNETETTLQDSSRSMPMKLEDTRTLVPEPKSKSEATVEDSGRERLKRHRVEVAGRVWIPDIWGQEDLLKDWIDCTAFDASLMNNNIMTARASLVEEGRRTNSSRLRIKNKGSLHYYLIANIQP